MDQQAKNRRIHELMGRGKWHEYHDAEHDNPKAVKGWRNIFPPSPDYYNDPTAAREALAFAVEQKGAEVVAIALMDKLIDGKTPIAILVALAPPEVLCESFLAVMDKEK